MTTPSETPRTDEAEIKTYWHDGRRLVFADFARQLERELNEAKQFRTTLITEIKQDVEKSLDRLNVLELAGIITMHRVEKEYTQIIAFLDHIGGVK